ncbi:hypothetical protein D3C75_981470 [compost metagenome]
MAIGEEVDFLFGKVDSRFDIDPQADQFFGEFIHTTGKFTLQRAQRITRRLCRTGFDEVGNRFGLGQVKLVIEECAFAEFTWAGQSATQLYTALQEHIQYYRTTVALEFQHVFAGERVRAGKKQRNAFIDDQAIVSTKRAVMGMPRRQ